MNWQNFYKYQPWKLKVNQLNLFLIKFTGSQLLSLLDCFCYPCYDGHVYYLGPHLQLYAYDQSFHKFHICVSICIRMLHRVESKTCISFVSFLVRFSFTTVTIFCWYSSLIVQPWCKIMSQECWEFLQYVSWSTCHRNKHSSMKRSTQLYLSNGYIKLMLLPCLDGTWYKCQKTPIMLVPT